MMSAFGGFLQLVKHSPSPPTQPFDAIHERNTVRNNAAQSCHTAAGEVEGRVSLRAFDYCNVRTGMTLDVLD